MYVWGENLSGGGNYCVKDLSSRLQYSNHHFG